MDSPEDEEQESPSSQVQWKFGHDDVNDLSAIYLWIYGTVVKPPFNTSCGWWVGEGTENMFWSSVQQNGIYLFSKHHLHWLITSLWLLSCFIHYCIQLLPQIGSGGDSKQIKEHVDITEAKTILKIFAEIEFAISILLICYYYGGY